MRYPVCPGEGMDWHKNKFNLRECPVCGDIDLDDALYPQRLVPAHYDRRPGATGSAE